MNANSSKQTITNLFVDGINHTEPCDIANVLNQFFVSAPAKIVEQIPPAGDPTINFNNEVIFSMQDSPITRLKFSMLLNNFCQKILRTCLVFQ